MFPFARFRQRPQRASCGLPHVDRFVDESFETVPGMSSRLSALVAATTLKIQAEYGITGTVLEIGAFEGRFLIPLAMCLSPPELAIGVDTFVWPDPAVRARLQTHLERHDVVDRCVIIQADSRELKPSNLIVAGGGHRARFIHIDGDHDAATLRVDLSLAAQCCHPLGVICLDDMLSPAYPTLYLEVSDFMVRFPGWMVVCVVDRETISASTKFLLCRSSVYTLYFEALLRAFPENVWPMGAQFGAYKALVLSSDPRLYRFEARPVTAES